MRTCNAKSAWPLAGRAPTFSTNWPLGGTLTFVEAEFVDNVTRHLRRGEFLLLIVGDGIRERAEKIVDFVQSHSGLRFNLALVEAALYRDGPDRLLVQPRVLARTEIVQRFVVDLGAEGESGEEDSGGSAEHQETMSYSDPETLRFMTAVRKDFAFSDPGAEISDTANS